MAEHGNAAAMREALKETSELVWSSIDPECNNDCCRPLRRIARIADAALAEPPRNCDRFADEQDAQLAFLNEVWLISVDKDSMLERDRFENWTDEMRAEYAKWLMAKAEGDSK